MKSRHEIVLFYAPVFKRVNYLMVQCGGYLKMTSTTICQSRTSFLIGKLLIGDFEDCYS